ncbi:MAG TPA: tRNA lysidine(34) synthetase TilS [Bacilli bacterium]|nr:tRNA lysidine(34) synthetase TilS [Bacilli bacterium]HPZ26776.1 tRNA lysidine(34) synthetase TilS [Bacilli bacterium]HQC89245.1 tRNA lysidine(34) synthetase TilS [Bacilli bacterium]
MIDRVIDFFEKNKLQLNNKKIVIAVSAGVDSMVLLEIFIELKARFDFAIEVAHINHQVRKQSKDEEKYIKTFCLRHNIKCHLHRLEANDDANFQDYARRERYAFFDGVMKEINADYLLTGHHADDNTETVIMRIMRGSGLKGYAGIAPVVNAGDYLLVRPLSNITKAEIYAYAEMTGVKYFQDESNFSDIYTRNRIRRNIVPSLVAEETDIHDKFREFSETLTGAWEVVATRVGEIINEMIESDGKKISFSRDEFAKLSEFLQYEVLFAILKRYRPSKSNVGEIIKLIHSAKKNLKVYFKNQFTVVKEYGVVSLYDGEIIKPVFDVEISKPGIYAINDSISVNVLKINQMDILKPDEVWYNNAMLPVRVRSRKPGDRILLSSGYKKIKDLLIDKKIGILTREKILVIEKDGEIIAVPGIARSRRLQKIKERNILIRVERYEG